MIVAIYARVSTQEQALHGYSIDEQVNRMQKYCESMNWSVYRAYVDAGYTGSNMNRPELRHLIHDVQEKRVEKVLVYKLDRLSRSQKDTLYLIEDVFVANGCGFASMNENFDTGTPLGIAMIGILSVFAQLERSQITERMMLGKSARAKQGKFAGGNHIPIGYDYDPDTGYLKVNEYEAMQVKRIFKEFLSGKPIFTIAKDLNAEGYTHKFGTWSTRTIRNVLESRTYLGELKYQGAWNKSEHAPLITEEEHADALRILRRNKDSHNTASVHSYLGGLLFCSKCGARYSKITANLGKDGKRLCYYKCNSRAKRHPTMIKDPSCSNKIWRMEDLDNLIFEEIKKLALEPTKPTEPEENNNLVVLTTELQKVEKQIDRLIDLYALGSISRSTLDAKIASQNAQKAHLEQELDNLRKSLPKSKEAFKSQINGFSEMLEKGTPEQIRQIITALIRRIELNGDDVTIYWNFK